jgi:hypothetical protein
MTLPSKTVPPEILEWPPRRLFPELVMDQSVGAYILQWQAKVLVTASSNMACSNDPSNPSIILRHCSYTLKSCLCCCRASAMRMAPIGFRSRWWRLMNSLDHFCTLSRLPVMVAPPRASGRPWQPQQDDGLSARQRSRSVLRLC